MRSAGRSEVVEHRVGNGIAHPQQQRLPKRRLGLRCRPAQRCVKAPPNSEQRSAKSSTLAPIQNRHVGKGYHRADPLPRQVRRIVEVVQFGRGGQRAFKPQSVAISDMRRITAFDGLRAPARRYERRTLDLYPSAFRKDPLDAHWKPHRGSDRTGIVQYQSLYLNRTLGVIPRQFRRRVGHHCGSQAADHDEEREDGRQHRSPDPVEEECDEQCAGSEGQQRGYGWVQPVTQEHSEQERRCDRQQRHTRERAPRPSRSLPCKSETPRRPDPPPSSRNPTLRV